MTIPLTVEQKDKLISLIASILRVRVSKDKKN